MQCEVSSFKNWINEVKITACCFSIFKSAGGFYSADQAALATRLHGVVGVFGILGAGSVEQVGY